jgi:hypothetical protein
MLARDQLLRPHGLKRLLYRVPGISCIASADTLLIIKLSIRLTRCSNEGGDMSTATRPEVREGYFPHWKEKRIGVIMPEERLPWGDCVEKLTAGFGMK